MGKVKKLTDDAMAWKDAQKAAAEMEAAEGEDDEEKKDGGGDAGAVAGAAAGAGQAPANGVLVNGVVAKEPLQARTG